MNRSRCRRSGTACRFQVPNELLLGEVPGSIERHVLDEVRQTPLVVVFEDRPRVDDQPQLGSILRPLVGSDVVAQPVVQSADDHSRIEGQRGTVQRALSGSGRGGEDRQPESADCSP